MQSLATRARPKSFAEVVGQNTVISILSRQVATKKFKHAYLFCGCSGSGKTTVARIMASELNDGEGEPIELDAATNNGVDSIRALGMEAQQMPIDCNYKVMVIDECHNLSKAAWDSALKLIEEPPEHAIFIFCTTNPNKVPETILSRLQRFDFKRVSADAIAGRLEFILQELVKNVSYETLALHRIAVLSRGNVRDAVRILEKCLDATDNLTADTVDSLLGICSIEKMVSLENAMFNKDAKKCVEILNDFRESCSDMKQVMGEIIGFAVDCALYAKLHDIYPTDLPNELSGRLPTEYQKSRLFADRLIDLYKYADSANAYVLMKTVCMEMCDE